MALPGEMGGSKPKVTAPPKKPSKTSIVTTVAQRPHGYVGAGAPATGQNTSYASTPTGYGTPTTTSPASAASSTGSFIQQVMSAAADAAGNVTGNSGNIIGGGTTGPFTGDDTAGTGWMSGIKPDAARMLMENPDAFLRQVMSRMGVDPDYAIGALQMASPMARNMNELAMIMLGGQDDYEAGEWNSAGNWMANMLANQMSPSGRYIDFGSGLNNLLGAQTTGPGQLTALGSILGIDDPAGQSQAFQSLANSLAATSLHPLWARAFQDELSRQGDAYVSKNATTTNMSPFNQWLGTRGY